MGSLASRATTTTTTAATRKFPTRVPDVDRVYRPVKDLGEYAAEAPALQNRPDKDTVVEGDRTAPVDLDGQDPQFLQMLRRAGPVQYGDGDKGKKGKGPVTLPDIGGTETVPRDPMGDMFAARQRLQRDRDDLAEAPVDGEARRTTLEMSDLVALLDARKAGASDADLEARFRLDPSLLPRLGRAVNTPTETGERDALGNGKAVWQERV